MQPYFQKSLPTSPQETHKKRTHSILSHHFNNINLQTTNSHSQIPDQYDDDHDKYEDEDEAEFSFATFGSISSPISADDVFKNGQIRPTYPLFNQNLFVADEDFNNSDNRLPLRPPVDKVFIEAPTSPSSSAKTGDLDGMAAGPKSPELSKKSNSTGFSKLWRFKDYMHRSHSDGRDAFVFLNNNNNSNNNNNNNSESTKKEKNVVQSKSKESNGVVGEKKKKEKTALSAHEVYLRNKGYGAEEDKRRSYLPYRPELVGFFTNVSGGGLTKNVHPY